MKRPFVGIVAAMIFAAGSAAEEGAVWKIAVAT
jgi:hypothetical protein